ncbi:MAG: PKD domain-containing protein [Syntrophomonadaceae bacterium]
MKRSIKTCFGMLLLALMFLLPAAIFPSDASAAATTSLTIKKLAVDGTTILSQKTVTYQELMAGKLGDGTPMPILGDGAIEYYSQGPVFIDEPVDETLEIRRWNPEENTNITDKNNGALKGTNVKDLCNLVGGMSTGETVKIKAADNFNKTFAYKNVYQYSDREGPMVICWYKNGLYPDSGYADGMRLHWFADTSVNPWGYHVFGNWDWHEAADSQYWYYFSGIYPTTTGLSVQNVSEIIIYSDDPVPAPVAAFSATPTSGTAPLTVNFTDASTGTAPLSWAWDFNNDGATDSTLQNPSHEYAAAGTYSVKLTVTNAGGSDEEIKTDYITVNPAPLAPVAAFTADKTSGAAPLTVNFTDQSTNTPTSWAWDFNNDGIVDSTLQNPSYTYTKPGPYTVKLTATNSVGSNDVIKTNYITVIVYADFPIQLIGNSTINLSKADMDAMLNTANTYTDGSGNVFEGVPLQQLIAKVDDSDPATLNESLLGTYKIIFTGLNQNGTDFPKEISAGSWGTVFTDGNIQTNDIFIATKVKIGGTGDFVDLPAVNPASTPKNWRPAIVSGNNIISTANSYRVGGLYKIELTGITPVAPTAAFSAAPTSGTAPLTVNFTDASTGTTPLSWAWDFDNDGTPDSTAKNPSHIYDTAGTYTVKLTVTNDVGSDEEIKTDYITVSAAPVAPVAAFTADVTSGQAPLTVSFTDQSTNGPTAWSWDFDNDGTVDSNAQNPSHTYDSAGTYTVKLTVTNGGGSDDAIKTNYITVSAAPTLDVLYDGTVTLTTGATYDITAYNSAAVHTVGQTTPLGALQATGLAYDVTDKVANVLLLDNVGTYLRDKTNKTYWYAYVNDSYKDGYNGVADALNVIQLVDGDKVEFYYAANISNPNDVNAVMAAAVAAVKTVADVVEPMDVLYEGTVNLTPGSTFSATAYNSSVSYTVSGTTALGALQATGLSYDITDKKFSTSGVLLLDNIGDYDYVKNGSKWMAYVNDVYKDGYVAASDALNIIELVHGDRVEFYYAAGITDPTDLNAVKAAATAAVKTVASTGIVPADWTLQLAGAKTQSVSKTYFENGLACSYSGHQVFWTDDKGTPTDTSDDEVWGGVPLWLLVGMVDDDPDIGPLHYNFNDDLAAQNYDITVIGGDGWSTTLDSAAIARNDGYIVANTLNGQPLPLQTANGKPCWPLHLKGSMISGGQQVGNIVRIELSGLPEPPQGWTLQMLGQVGDTITQEEFEDGLACTGSGHLVSWTDTKGTVDTSDDDVYSGVPLWLLLGVIDDIEMANHWTFNDGVVTTNPYTVKVIASDGYSRTFDGAVVAKNNNYIVANRMNGAPLTDKYPLRLVGDGVKKPDGSLSGASVGQIVKIEIPELQTPAALPGSWNLKLTGKISDVISEAEFQAALACPTAGHYAEWADINGDVWSGIPLWFLAGWADDRQPHEFNTNQALSGYTILVKAGDGYSKGFASGDVSWSNNYIVANRLNGAPLGDAWPLRLVGPGVTRPDGSLSGSSVGQIAEIELTDFNTVVPVPELRIVKYDADLTTIIDEKTVDYLWMQGNLDVIGDGTTIYRYEGLTLQPDNLWDPEETYPGGFKIANAIKGTRVQDLCELVGGMGAGTEIELIASDGYRTILPYSSIYPDPIVQARQGDAILAWYADGKYVPGYGDGMRLFFTPEDHVYGQWDMHETLSENYWHYNYQNGVNYPSCAGLSTKNITTIKIYSVPASDWKLQLDGEAVGGMKYEVSKSWFETALGCTMGANHKTSYTDASGQWEGMPLWFLAGYVDDSDQHSDHAFNETLAQAGYRVVITATDNYSTTIDSPSIIRNSDYIIANTLDGVSLAEDSGYWPLKLVGPAVSKKASVGQIAKIELLPGLTPVAAFSSDIQTGVAPLTVAFTNSSTGTAPLTYAWDFDNDGNVDSTDQNPSYEYTQAGTYSVKLTVSNGAGSDDEIKTDYIIVNAASVAPVAAFNATPTSGTAPLPVAFTSSSTGTAPLTYAWDFDNDGNVDSTDQNPSYEYTQAGTYSVRLTVTNAAGSDDEIKTDYITVDAPDMAPVAAFSATPTSGTTPLTVAFTDESTGTAPLTYAWDFDNDGSVDSTDQNPSYEYTQAGTYSVKLTVTNAAGSDIELKTNFIKVGSIQGDTISPKWRSARLTADDISETSLILTWTPATDNIEVTEYKIFIDGDLWDTVAGDTSSCQVEGLSAVTAYRFKVEAGDQAGNWTKNGPSARVTTKDEHAPVWTDATLSAQTSRNSIVLTWSAAVDNVQVTEYKICCNGELVGKAPGKKTTYSVSQGELKKLYRSNQAGDCIFTVQAGDKAGNWSTDGPATTVSILETIGK